MCLGTTVREHSHLKRMSIRSLSVSHAILFKWNLVPSFKVTVSGVMERDLAHASCEFSSISRWFEFQISSSGNVLSDISGSTLVFGSLRFLCRSFDLLSLMENWWRTGHVSLHVFVSVTYHDEE